MLRDKFWGTDVAVEAGDVVLVRSDPRDVPWIVTLSRASYRNMVENLWWASGYNILAIPLAAGLLASSGSVLSPAVGAVLMSLSPKTRSFSGGREFDQRLSSARRSRSLPRNVAPVGTRDPGLKNRAGRPSPDDRPTPKYRFRRGADTPVSIS
jgi:hypothetical protein